MTEDQKSTTAKSTTSTAGSKAQDVPTVEVVETQTISQPEVLNKISSERRAALAKNAGK